MVLLVKPIALAKCRDRLTKAQAALQSCRRAKHPEEFASAWADLLTHAGSVLNILEGSSRHIPQGRQWYGELKRDCKADPLINYMYQARNAEEHEDAPTIDQGSGLLMIGRPGESFRPESITTDSRGKMIIRLPASSKIPSVFFTPSGPQLQPIYDSRYKQTFPPPMSHAGLPLIDLGPIHVGFLYLAWMEALVAQLSASQSF